MIVQIWDGQGSLLASTYPALAVPLQAADGFEDVKIGSQRWRIYSVHTPARTVQAIQDAEFRVHVINKQALQAGLPIALLIPISAVILWLAIRVALRRLEAVARAAAAQDENTIAELPTKDVPCEISPLVMAVNRLLTRLRDAFASQRRFVQDAAHELRTPITAMTLQLENLKACSMDAETTAQVAQFEAGLRRTKRLIEQLLRLARQEAPQKADAASNIELAEFLRDLISDLMPCADHRDIDLGLSVDINATVRANPHELRSLLHNLLDNALRYTPDHGVVDVRLSPTRQSRRRDRRQRSRHPARLPAARVRPFLPHRGLGHGRQRPRPRDREACCRAQPHRPARSTTASSAPASWPASSSPTAIEGAGTKIPGKLSSAA